MSGGPRESTPADRALATALDAAAQGPSMGRWLAGQRWSGAKGRAVDAVDVVDVLAIDESVPATALALIDATFAGATEPSRYAVAVTMADGAGASAITPGVSDGTDAEALPRTLIALMATEATRATSAGAHVTGRKTPAMDELLGAAALRASVRRLAGEQSNTSWVIGERIVLKLLRRLRGGIHPDAEVTGFLTRVRFAHAPQLAGVLEHVTDQGPTVVAVAQAFAPSRGDAWKTTLQDLAALLDGRLEIAQAVAPLERLGSVVAEMHVALASDASAEAFAPQPATAHDRQALLDSIATRARDVADAATRAGESRARLEALATRALGGVRALAAAIAGLDASVRTVRTHGDLHLGQVLATQDGGFVVIDFEGEPSRPLAARRQRDSALRDVAGMLRSFAYAAAVARREHAGEGRDATTTHWERAARESFLRGYASTLANAPVTLVPGDAAGRDALLAAFELDKALYEVRYEVDHRPDWVAIPAEGVERALDSLEIR